MARYQDDHSNQGKFIAVSFDRQILPGTFEHTISILIDKHLDLSAFDQRYDNDDKFMFIETMHFTFSQTPSVTLRLRPKVGRRIVDNSNGNLSL